jgi:hypothetical protein
VARDRVDTLAVVPTMLARILALDPAQPQYSQSDRFTVQLPWSGNFDFFRGK